MLYLLSTAHSSLGHSTRLQSQRIRILLNSLPLNPEISEPRWEGYSLSWWNMPVSFQSEHSWTQLGLTLQNSTWLSRLQPSLDVWFRTLPALFNILQVHTVVQSTTQPDCVTQEPMQPEDIKSLCLIQPSASLTGGTFWNYLFWILPGLTLAYL